MSPRFSHLISVDFFSDLMSVLHSLAETGVSEHVTQCERMVLVLLHKQCVNTNSVPPCVVGSDKQGVHVVCAHGL